MSDRGIALESAVAGLSNDAGVGRAASTIAVIGDSLTGPNGYPAATYAATTANEIAADGYFTWANAYMGARMELVKNAGIGGQGVPTIAARFAADILSMDPLPGRVAIVCGTNSISDVGPDSQITAALTGIIGMAEAALAKGVSPIVATVTRKGAAVYPVDGIYATRMAYVNEGLREYARRTPGVVLADFAAVTSNGLGDWRTGYAADSVHPEGLGKQAMGHELARVLAPLVPAIDGLPDTNTDPGNLVGNGMMIGDTSGYATGWAWNGAGGTVTASKVARTDRRPGAWQQLIAASAASSLSHAVTGLVAGDVVVAEAELEAESLASCTNLGMRLRTQVTAGVREARCHGDGTPIVTPEGRLVLRTLPIKVGAGLSSAALHIDFTATSGTLRVGRTSVRKVA